MHVIGICSDHAGFELKEYIKLYFKDKDTVFMVDFGSNSSESCDYPVFGHKLAESIEDGFVDVGIAICGTGQGMSMTLNKHEKVRCALCWNADIAKFARLHNDANVIALPARFIWPDQAVKTIETFLNTEFEGGRHQKRIDLIPIRKDE